MSKYNKLSYYFLQFKNKINSYISLRHKKLIAVIFLLFLFIFYFLKSNKKETYNSAVGCKSEIAKVAITDMKKRDKWIGILGTDYSSLEDDFYDIISRLTLNCQNQEHFGPPEEGGWDVCLERRFNIMEPCLVYSFGIGNDFRFEKHIESYLKCQVHSFDPSMNRGSGKYSENGYFHNYGIDSIDTVDPRTGWTLKRLSTIMKELDHYNDYHIDLLKMDVEFSEWLVLYDLLTTRYKPSIRETEKEHERDVVESAYKKVHQKNSAEKPTLLSRIRQLVLEIHTPEVDIHLKPSHKCTFSSGESVAFMLRIMLELKNVGFALFVSRINYRTYFISQISRKQRYCCYNLHFVNQQHPLNKY